MALGSVDYENNPTKDCEGKELKAGDELGGSIRIKETEKTSFHPWYWLEMETDTFLLFNFYESTTRLNVADQKITTEFSVYTSGEESESANPDSLEISNEPHRQIIPLKFPPEFDYGNMRAVKLNERLMEQLSATVAPLRLARD